MPASYGILPADQGGGLLPWSWARERLERSRNYWITTVRVDGRPHSVPVWGTWLDNRFYFSTDRATQKAINLAHNPRCVICPENLAEAISVEGTAREVTEVATIRRHLAAYDPKYHWKSKETDGPFFEVTPSRVLAFIEGQGNEVFVGRATRWVFR